MGDLHLSLFFFSFSPFLSLPPFYLPNCFSLFACLPANLHVSLHICTVLSFPLCFLLLYVCLTYSDLQYSSFSPSISYCFSFFRTHHSQPSAIVFGPTLCSRIDMTTMEASLKLVELMISQPQLICNPTSQE